MFGNWGLGPGDEGQCELWAMQGSLVIAAKYPRYDVLVFTYFLASFSEP